MNGELVHWFTKSKGNGGDKMKKHCILWTVVITLIVSWFLFFPWSKQVLEDGGTIVYLKCYTNVVTVVANKI